MAPSTTYRVGFYIGTDSPEIAGYGLFPTRILVDGIALTLIDPPTPFFQVDMDNGGNGSTPANFLHLFGDFTTGSSQTTASVFFVIGGSGDERGALSFDDFHFGERVEAVPEPGTLGLFGVALAAMALARRRLHG